MVTRREPTHPEGELVTLEDRDGAPVTFRGELLARASSQEPLHTHLGSTPEDGERCSACRWFEVAIYRTLEAENELPEYVVHTQGVTTVPGETLRTRVIRTAAPHWVVECLVQRRGSGDPFIPTVSRQALAEAAALDAPLEDAFINRVVA